MTTHIKSFFAAVLLISFLSVGVNAAVKLKSEVVTIQTSDICGLCKNKLEAVLTSVDGVKEITLNPADKKIEVKYDPYQISPEQIRTIISHTGLDAR